MTGWQGLGICLGVGVLIRGRCVIGQAVDFLTFRFGGSGVLVGDGDLVGFGRG